MPKRKRGSSESAAEAESGGSSPKKSRSVSQSPSVSTTMSPSHSHRLPQRGRRQIVPKAGMQQIPDALDQLLFFRLLSCTKPPSNAFEWDLMAQAFVHNRQISGETLSKFYSVLLQNGSIYDPRAQTTQTQTQAEAPSCIDFGSDDYRNAQQQFMHKLGAFNHAHNIAFAPPIQIEHRDVDLFCLYILVTKHGGLDILGSAWTERVLHEMSTHLQLNAHTLLRQPVIDAWQDTYRRYLYPYEQTYYDAQALDAIDEDDDFGADLYLEESTDIMNMVAVYPLRVRKTLKTEPATTTTTSSPNEEEHKCDANSNSGGGAYWLEVTRSGNHLPASMFNHAVQCRPNLSRHRRDEQQICVSGDDRQLLLTSLSVNPVDSNTGHNTNDDGHDDDDDADNDDDIEGDDISVVLRSMMSHGGNVTTVPDAVDIMATQSEFISRQFSIVAVKGVHPFTRRYIFETLKECESDVSLHEVDKISVLSPDVEKTASHNPRKSSLMQKQKSPTSHLLKKSSLIIEQETFKLRRYEVNCIIDELIVKMLTMQCAVNDLNETSMMIAFHHGLRLLRAQFEHDKNGFTLYKQTTTVRSSNNTNHECTYYVYFKRILSSFEKFVSKTAKKHHHFLSHPKGFGLVMIGDALIRKHTFLSEVYGKMYSCARWIEHVCNVQQLQSTLQSSASLFAEYPLLLEYMHPGDEYHVLAVLHHHDLQLSQSAAILNNGAYHHWTAKLNHSCAPNCCLKMFLHRSRVRIGLFSIRDIKKGDEVSIDYHAYQWQSYNHANVCKEAICLCGMAHCRGTFVRYRDVDVENGVLSGKHAFVDRLVQLLNCSLTPLTDDERAQVRRLCVSVDGGTFGDWFYKYVAFLCTFIESEFEVLPQHLYHAIDKKEEYTQLDAQNDAKHVLQRRMRALSITTQRLSYFLRQQQALFASLSEQRDTIALAVHQQKFMPAFIQAFARDDNLFLLPPIQFAEIDHMIARLWNDDDSLINRLLRTLSDILSPALHHIVSDIVREVGLVQESQQGLTLVRTKLIEIAKILSMIKSTKKNRHLAAADVLYLYAKTYRFCTLQPYLSFASPYNDVAVLSNYRDVKQKNDNRYLTRSVRKEDHVSDDSDDDAQQQQNSDAQSLSQQQRYVYCSSFPLLLLLGWHHNDLAIVQNVNDRMFAEYNEHMFGTVLLPDIESCYDSKTKGLYLITHRKYLWNCIEQRTNWMDVQKTRDYETKLNAEIGSCAVPQFTFTNSIGLFGSPVFDSYFEPFKSDNKYLTKIVRGLQNNYK